MDEWVWHGCFKKQFSIRFEQELAWHFMERNGLKLKDRYEWEL
jgi:hypothetical protein